jgi:aryl-alcohol dehydrogenase-like predicted oxidoreductase
MNDATVLATLVAETDMDIVMLAGRYTLLEQDALDDLLPLCTERGVGVIAAGIFNSGLLARAEPQSQATYNYEQAPPELIGRARDRCRLQSPRDHAPRRRDRLPPRSSGSPERLCRSAFGRSDPAQRGSVQPGGPA